MVLTDRQRGDLHSAIYEYLQSREEFKPAAEALKVADPESCTKEPLEEGKTPILEKKWTAIPRLQRKVLELERSAAQSAKIHAHRAGTGGSDAASGGARRMLPRLPCAHTLKGHAAVVTSVKVHPVFTVAVSGSEDGTIKVWDHESGDYMRTLKGHTHTVTDLAFTPKGSHLASSSVDLSIKLWNFTTYACLRTLRGHDHTISSIRFLPSKIMETASGSGTTESNTTTGLDAEADGCTHLVSASRDHTVKLWHVETGFCDHTFSDHNDWVRCLAVRASDGKFWASSGNDQVVYVYDNNRTKVVELRGHEHVVESLAFITEESFPKNTRENKHNETVRDYLASGSRDRSVRLWKVSSGECLGVFNSHENWVRSVLIHPNGKYIISCGDDRTIRVFDIQAKRCLRTLEHAHDHFVSSIDMHHTLPILVSGGVDQTVRCWMLD